MTLIHRVSLVSGWLAGEVTAPAGRLNVPPKTINKHTPCPRPLHSITLVTKVRVCVFLLFSFIAAAEDSYKKQQQQRIPTPFVIYDGNTGNTHIGGTQRLRRGKPRESVFKMNKPKLKREDGKRESV